MAVPRSMVAHTLNVVKGWHHQSALDFSAKISSAVQFVVFSGRAMHLDSAGELRTGVDTNGMTLFLFPNSDDPDVQNDGGDPAVDADAWVGVTPSGKALALPAKGAYELESTEFDTTLLYPPNTLLTAVANDVTQSIGGVLTTGTKYVNHICGVVSRGVVPSNYLRGKNALAFWPVWLPPT